MREQLEYHSIHFPGLTEDEIENIDTATINRLLKDRVRQYNRLGGEGWTLVAEHMDPLSYAAVATFRRQSEHAAMATDTTESPPSPTVPPSSPSYPTLQPTSGSSDAFRLVWEK